MRWIAASLALLLPLAAGAAEPASDQPFLDRAQSMQEGLVDVAALAQHKGGESVRLLGEHMQREHRAALERLHALAAKDDLMLPNVLQDPEVQLFKRLDSLGGRAFDEAYLSSLAEREADLVALYTDEAQGGKTRDVRAYAAAELPRMRAIAANVRAMAAGRTPRSQGSGDAPAPW